MSFDPLEADKERQQLNDVVNLGFWAGRRLGGWPGCTMWRSIFVGLFVVVHQRDARRWETVVGGT